MSVTSVVIGLESETLGRASRHPFLGTKWGSRVLKLVVTPVARIIYVKVLWFPGFFGWPWAIQYRLKQCQGNGRMSDLRSVEQLVQGKCRRTGCSWLGRKLMAQYWAKRKLIK